MSLDFADALFEVEDAREAAQRAGALRAASRLTTALRLIEEAQKLVDDGDGKP